MAITGTASVQYGGCTKRAYPTAISDFMRFTGIARPEEFPAVTRAHVIAWREELRTRLTRRGTPGTSLLS
jgi:hypothetical protein